MSSNSSRDDNSGCDQQCGFEDLESDSVILVSRQSSDGEKATLEAPLSIEKESNLPTDGENADDVHEFGMRCEVAIMREQPLACDCCFEWTQQPTIDTSQRGSKQPHGDHETSLEEFDDVSAVFEETGISKEKDQTARSNIKKGLEQPKPQVEHIESTKSKANDTKQATKKRIEKYAILVRKDARHAASDQPIHSIMIQSPLIKKVLRDIFVDNPYNYLDSDSKAVIQTSPFDSLVIHWDKLQHVAEHDQCIEVSDHVKLLMDTVQPTLEEPLQIIKMIGQHRAVSFDFLWTIFKPGVIVYLDFDASSFGLDRLARVTDSRYSGANVFEVFSEFIVWSTNGFTLSPISSIIERYEGTCDIISLVTFPLQFHPEQINIKQNMLERGRCYEKLGGLHFKSYTGEVVNGDIVLKNTNERVLIGEELYTAMNSQMITRTAGPLIKNGHPNHVYSHGRSRPRPGLVWDSDFSQQDSHDRTIFTKSDTGNLPDENEGSPEKPHNPKPLHQHTAIPLTEDQLLICSPYIDAYLISQKKWGSIRVDKIKDIEWDDTFNELVLPNGEKELILSFVEEHVKSKARCGDLTKDKAKNLVILLRGPSGVGKTLVAEAMAEKLHMPLIKINPDHSDRSWLRDEGSAKVINNTWNAILLLEESESFVQDKETIKSLKETKILNAFLTHLGTCGSVVFITTNRAEPLDPALESRVDLTLEITTPGHAERRQLWAQALPGFRLKEVYELAEKKLNGRQINSAVKMARLWAAGKGEDVRVEHVERMMELKGW